MRRHHFGTAKLAAVAVATALSLSALTACGGGGSGGSGSSGALEMWTFKQSHVAGLQAAAADFEKSAGVKVKIEAYTPDDAFATKIQSSAKTGDLPDVMETHSDGEDLGFGASGIAAELTSVVNDAWLARYPETVRTSGYVDAAKFKESQDDGSKMHGVKQGARHSVPFTIGTFGIVYANKKMLTDAGIARPPATWAEFVEALKATHAKDAKNGGLALGLKVPDTGITWLAQPLAYSMLGRSGYEALFGKDKAANWSSPNGVKVLQAYDQVTPYWMPGTQTLGIDEADQAFAQGKAAWLVGGTFTLAFLGQNGMKPDDVYAFGLPGDAAGKVPDPALGPLALTSLILSATSKQPENAKKWMEYLSQPEVAAKFSKASTDLPATELGAESSSIVGPALASLLDSFKGTPEGTYDPRRREFFPPGYKQDKAGAILVDMSPLKKVTPEQTGQKLTELTESFWATSQ
ncbi:ABC transporter substrate-binding protein [Nonomuraea endophytica]|uniref:Multiple sugar transport system substrate-binding protein n=1 Tax=Nonomuraea endophytica TaxID=714136 RepID=A0A7W8EFI9_9ACTN|nr:extracellular solute-binding protein [Nonomuraea endophytica]MBB5078820.1 multiple sugar transport system substrate-binding protein [Nonomuraea endophytica]